MAHFMHGRDGTSPHSRHEYLFFRLWAGMEFADRPSHGGILTNECFVAPAVITVYLRVSFFIRARTRAPPQLLAAGNPVALD